LTTEDHSFGAIDILAQASGFTITRSRREAFVTEAELKPSQFPGGGLQSGNYPIAASEKGAGNLQARPVVMVASSAPIRAAQKDC
jgi:hypothetical protein